jgi:hypothetical protein
MRKLIGVGVLVGGLLAGAGSAMAAPLPGQGGIGDPLTLAASGVLIPFITSGGTVAVLEIASPVSNNPFMHMVFFNATCVRGESQSIPETTNEIEFTNIGDIVAPGTNGLVAIANGDPSEFTLVPLTAPIHTRVYEFEAPTGRSRVFEPIIVDTAEFGVTPIPPIPSNNSHIWSPLRTAATFYAPVETSTVHTQLTLVCPRTTIQGAPGAAFGSGTGPFSSSGFPVIDPVFITTPAAGDMRARVYDVDENLLRDTQFQCDCLTPDFSVLGISSIYNNAVAAPFGTYTELSENSPTVGSFTGYRDVFTVGSAINHFWGRLSNGSRPSIEGPLPVSVR